MISFARLRVSQHRVVVTNEEGEESEQFFMRTFSSCVKNYDVQ